MTDMGSESLFSRSARGLVHQVGEIIHVCAIYLGIAVLVTVVVSVTIPSLREQSQQMHAALLAVLRPDALNVATGSFSLGQADFFTDAGLFLTESAATGEGGRTAAPPKRDSGAGSKAGASAATSSVPAFGTEFASLADGLSIPGITGTQAQALRSYIARKYKIAHNVAAILIKIAFSVGKEKQLDPQLLLAVIAIESRYNPFAESHVGAQGLMQVMTKVHKEKFEPFGGDTNAALNPIANIRVGSQILHDCIKRRGSVEAGLSCYVGAVGPGDGGYGEKVLAERRRIALASGIPIARN